MIRRLMPRMWKTQKSLSEESRETLLSTISPGSPSTAKDVHMCECCGQVVGRHELPRSKQGAQWAIIVCLLCTLINCLVTIEGSCSVSGAIPIINKGQYDTLKRPSPFIGLDKIKRSGSPVPRSVLNYPQVIAQIDAADPRKVFDDDPLRYMSHTGYVSPEDRRVKISPSISTIVQFRAIDFGMEKCELNLKIPPSISNPVNASVQSILLSVHRLRTKQPINTRALAYSNSPPRLTTVANIQIVPGSPISWKSSFHCAWDDVLTFEIGCSNYGVYETDACSLEWWQNKEDDDPSHGVFIVQHSTI